MVFFVRSKNESMVLNGVNNDKNRMQTQSNLLLSVWKRLKIRGRQGRILSITDYESSRVRPQVAPYARLAVGDEAGSC